MRRDRIGIEHGWAARAVLRRRTPGPTAARAARDGRGGEGRVLGNVRVRRRRRRQAADERGRLGPPCVARLSVGAELEPPPPPPVAGPLGPVPGSLRGGVYC